MSLTIPIIDSAFESHVLPILSARAYSKLTSFSGNMTILYSFVGGTVLEQCQQACDNVGFCMGYAIDSLNPLNCNLLKSISQSMSLNASSTITAYVYTHQNYLHLRNTDFNGESLGNVNVPFDQCASMCAITLNCLGYTTMKDVGSGCIFKGVLTDNPSFNSTRYLNHHYSKYQGIHSSSHFLHQEHILQSLFSLEFKMLF